jgi:DNA invertase Pin-like site-specific DNA recombinase
MDEMLADLISEGTIDGFEAARARGRTGGRKPKLTARQITVARQMYDQKGADGKRRYTVCGDRRNLPRLPQDDLPPPRNDQ